VDRSPKEIEMRRLPAVVAPLVLALAVTGPAMAANGSDDQRAKLYYVSVGDSLAAGVQPIGDPSDQFRTDAGYPEQLLGMARTTFSKLSLVKLGCPGETTATMIAGGTCSYPHGSQLDEAVSFLRSHRPHVAFVTIDIGANDFPCQEPSCVPAGVAGIQANLPSILAALRDAAGPGVPVVGMTIYNPFLASWLQGAEGQAIAQLSAAVMAQLNGMLRAIYAASGVAVAEVDAAFSSDDFGTIVSLPGVGLVPLNVARICQWTWVCAPAPLAPNNHANADGYGVIAQAFAAALGV
jgi:lysophospholipase L1-like esterase